MNISKLLLLFISLSVLSPNRVICMQGEDNLPIDRGFSGDSNMELTEESQTTSSQTDNSQTSSLTSQLEDDGHDSDSNDSEENSTCFDLPLYLWCAIIGDIETLNEILNSHRDAGYPINFDEVHMLPSSSFFSGTLIDIANRYCNQDVRDYLINYQNHFGNYQTEQAYTYISIPYILWFTLIGDFDAISKILVDETLNKQEINLDQIYDMPLFNGSLLHFACLKNHLKIAEFLADNGANVNLTNADGYTPLHCACLYNDPADNDDMASLLIEKNAFLLIKDNTGYTALHRACQAGKIRIAKKLFKHPHDLLTTNIRGDNILHSACYTNDIKMVRCILAQAESVNLRTEIITACNNNSKPPLYMACQKNNVDIISLLTDTEDVFTITDDQKCLIGNVVMYPLHISCWLGSYDAAVFFIEKGVSVYDLDQDNLTPLLLICLKDKCSKKDIQLAEKILTIAQEQSHLDTLISSDHLPLHHVCIRGYTKLAKLLLHYGATSGTCDFPGRNALSYACQHGHNDIISILLEDSEQKGPAYLSTLIENIDSQRMTPFHYACENGHIKAILIFIEHNVHTYSQELEKRLLGVPSCSGLANSNFHHMLSFFINSIFHNFDNHVIKTDETCVICQADDLEDGDVCVKLSCGHIFHQECLEHWKKETCPLCRAKTNIEHFLHDRCKQLGFIKKDSTEG